MPYGNVKMDKHFYFPQAANFNKICKRKNEITDSSPAESQRIYAL